METESLESKLVPILKSYGATKVGIFGSYATGKATADSDIDLLVDFSEQKSLLTLVRIKRELSEALGIVATNRGNRWFFVYGFEKNTRSNITTKEKEALQYLAEDLLGLSTEQLNAAVEDKSLEEIDYE